MNLTTPALPPPRPERATSSDCIYVVHLHRGDPTQPHRLSGRIEHVLSGRRHDFDTAAALLGCLVHEQTQQAAAAIPSPIPVSLPDAAVRPSTPRRTE